MPVKKGNKKTKAAEPTKAPEGKTISVANLARELGVDPKKARAKMRNHGMSAEGKRYKDLIIGSKEHTEISELIAP